MTKEEQKQPVTHVKIGDYYFDVTKAEVYEGRGNYKHQVLVRTRLSRFDGMKWIEGTGEPTWFEGTQNSKGFDKSHPTWNAVWMSRAQQQQHVVQWLWLNEYRDVSGVDYSDFKNVSAI